MDCIVFKHYKTSEKESVMAITEPRYYDTLEGLKEDTIQLI